MQSNANSNTDAPRDARGGKTDVSVIVPVYNEIGRAHV